MSSVVAGERDAGFTLVEVLVSLVIITLVMVPLTAYFVGGIRLTHHQGDQQTAARLALDATERARALNAAAMLVGRAPCGVCPAPVGPGTAAFLSGTQRWDAAVPGITATLPLPGAATPDTVTLDGVTFRRHHYLGRCWQPAGGGACDADSSRPVGLYRLVVAVTWPGRQCAGGVCTYVATALFSGGKPDPVFGT